MAAETTRQGNTVTAEINEISGKKKSGLFYRKTSSKNDFVSYVENENFISS